jgi:hypothetical protein
VTRRTVLCVAIACLAGLLVLALVVWFVYRPWALSWGATDEEVARAMPGDELVLDPSFCATRAVTIDAPPEQIWPWIVQMGYRQAGFYSYDRLDNDGIPSAEQILPEYQDVEVGDLMPLSRSAAARVTELEADRTMVLVFEVEGTWEGSTWVWGLYPQGASHTRLVSRLRVDAESIPAQVFLDLGEIVMMRKCMLGIKRRAEALEPVL